MQVAEDLSLQWDPIQQPELCAHDPHEGLPGLWATASGAELQFQLYLRTGSCPAPVMRPSGGSADRRVPIPSANETGAISGSDETAAQGLSRGRRKGKELVLQTVIQLDDLVPVGELQGSAVFVRWMQYGFITDEMLCSCCADPHTSFGCIWPGVNMITFRTRGDLIYTPSSTAAAWKALTTASARAAEVTSASAAAAGPASAHPAPSGSAAHLTESQQLSR